jgi:hypothetical protein
MPTLPRRWRGAAGETITPPPRAVLGIRIPLPITGLAPGTVLACGDPSDSGPTVGTLAGTVQDVETDAPIEEVSLAAAGPTVVTDAAGVFEIDSVLRDPSKSECPRTDTSCRLRPWRSKAEKPRRWRSSWFPDLGPPGPANAAETTSADAPGAVTVSLGSDRRRHGLHSVYWGTHSPANARQGDGGARCPESP